MLYTPAAFANATKEATASDVKAAKAEAAAAHWDRKLKIVQVQKGKDDVDRVFWVKHGLEGEKWTKDQLLDNKQPIASRLTRMSYMNLYPTETV